MHRPWTIQALFLESRRLWFASLALAPNAVLYTLVYIFLAVGGAPSSFRPWLAILSDVYYQYKRFLLAPSMVLCWILAAGVAQDIRRMPAVAVGLLAYLAYQGIFVIFNR